MPDNTSRDPNWWRNALVYQIYPRSFADANGDGIGDFKGVTTRVDYLKSLGADAVWFSPFYPSELKDGGYDVADYRNVDPRIGTLEDFDKMVETLRTNGIKVLVDIVPNHCSEQHPWFQAALKSPRGSKERDMFFFRDGLGEKHDQPPNDWQSTFGGSAWSAVGDGQFYFHLYDSSQPDLNWDNEAIRADFVETLKFWAERGVQGFRIDVAAGMVKDMSEPYLSQKEVDVLRGQMDYKDFPPNGHPLRDRDGVIDIYRQWRKEVFEKYDPPLVGVAEAWVASHRRGRYAAQDALGQCFAFETLCTPYAPHTWKKTIQTLMDETKAVGSTPVWTISNHDVVRHLSRLGLPGVEGMVAVRDSFQTKFVLAYLYSRGADPAADLELGSRRAKALILLLMALPGSLYLYQGEELGLPEVVDIPDSDRQDPTFFRTKGQVIGRDGCRVSIPWTQEGTNFGFGSGKPSHLPMPNWLADYSVEKEDKDPSSFLNFYREALQCRKQLIKESGEDFKWMDCGERVLRIARGRVEVMMNFGPEAVEAPEGDLLICSASLQGSLLPPESTIWVKK